jgi:hypothetical protein
MALGDELRKACAAQRLLSADPNGRVGRDTAKRILSTGLSSEATWEG